MVESAQDKDQSIAREQKKIKKLEERLTQIAKEKRGLE
jgi:hypothetical protein